MGEPLVLYTPEGLESFERIFRNQKPGKIIPVKYMECRPIPIPQGEGLDAEDADHDETRA